MICCRKGGPTAIADNDELALQVWAARVVELGSAVHGRAIWERADTMGK